MDGFFNWLSQTLASFGNTIVQLLPRSPFRQFIDSINFGDYLGFLNWFFPVSQLLTVMAIWLTAIGLFYFYSVIMRWIKLIGD